MVSESKKIGILEDAGKIISEEEKQALDILEIDTELDGHHTPFSFKKAVLDKDFIWELTIEVEDLPTRVNLNYDLYLILDPTNFNVSLEAQYGILQEKQLDLLDPKKKHPLEEMKRIHREYKKDRELIGDYKFTARLSELKNKQTETLNFIVSGDVVREFEKLRLQGTLHRLTLVLESI